MNKIKHIKKLLRNKNRTAVELLEINTWGAGRFLGEFKTFDILYREILLWRQQLQEKHGASTAYMLDLPMLVFRLVIYNEQGSVLYSEIFDDGLDGLKDFLPNSHEEVNYGKP
jgi:hypothetical protein